KKVRQNGPLSWEKRLKIAVGSARGLRYLHSQRPQVLHRDVKAPNILITDSYVAKVADFGCAKLIKQTILVEDPTTGEMVETLGENVDVAMGTHGHMAPEILMTGEISAATDVYSFGVVLLELLSGRVPVFEDGTMLTHWGHISTGTGATQRCWQGHISTGRHWRHPTMFGGGGHKALGMVVVLLKILRGREPVFETSQNNTFVTEPVFGDGTLLTHWLSHTIPERQEATPFLKDKRTRGGMSGSILPCLLLTLPFLLVDFAPPPPPPSTSHPILLPHTFQATPFLKDKRWDELIDPSMLAGHTPEGGGGEGGVTGGTGAGASADADVALPRVAATSAFARCAELVESCIQFDPLMRPSMEDVAHTLQAIQLAYQA
ncbi:unnamed protein product, partial [Closterium sp. NIES-64]